MIFVIMIVSEGPNSKRFNVWTDSTLLIVQQNSSQRGSMLALIQHSQVTSVLIGDHQSLGPVQHRNFTTRGTSRQLGSWEANGFFILIINTMADLTWNVVRTPKWSSLAGVSPLGLNAQPFLRSQGPRMGYTSELYQCGFEAIGFVCRKSTMMESLCAGDSSSCRWVVLVSPGFPFSSVVMFNRFIWAALWIHIMGMKVHDCSRSEQLNKSVYGWQMETQFGKTKYQYWYFPTLWPHLRFVKIYLL